MASLSSKTACLKGPEQLIELPGGLEDRGSSPQRETMLEPHCRTSPVSLLMLGAGSVLLPWDLNSPRGTTALITEGAQTQDTAVFLGALEMQSPRFYPRPPESDSLRMGPSHLHLSRTSG